ncbi:MAG TPA: FAD-dependent oxidoreductase [Ktedonobacteraceae bacterium]|nr:FAD-dependent oxidoreductase [Ktedonobacteraceae bacterium]
MSFDVLIVGAGIVGTACAFEFAAAGLSVGVIENDVVGSGATAAGMGHIVVMDDSEEQLHLTRYSQMLWDTLVQEAPEQHEYFRCGTIWIAADEEEMQAVSPKHAFYSQHGIPSEILDASQLYALEPHLSPGLAGGLLVPGDSVVYPPRSAAFLLKRASEYGARLLKGTATRLVPGGVQLADGQIVQGGAVVIANGAHVRELAPEVPCRPKKGHLVITDRYPDFIRHQLVELGYIKNAHASSGDSVSFNVQPRSTGQLLIGSSRQFDIESSAIDYAILSKMLARALDYLPGLAQLSCIRTWTGLRAATPDGLPLIGPHPSRSGVWLATGHEGLGITTSLGTARLLAAQMLARTPEIPIEPYLPSRVLQEVKHA